MPQISLNYADPQASGTDAPSPGSVTVALAQRDATTTPGTIRTTRPFPVHIDAQGAATFTFQPTPAGNAMVVTEEGVYHSRTRYYSVPDLSGPLTEADLTPLDPSTLEPSSDAQAAWDAAAQQLLAALTVTSGPNPPDDATPGTFYLQTS